jgi:cardiolipin synthase
MKFSANLPNTISLIRLLLAPLSVWLVMKGHLEAAFWVFLGAGVSDAIDGYLARLLNAETVLGQYLDPIADKLLLVSMFVSLGVTGYIAPWLVILAVSRDAMILGWVLLANFLGARIKVRPIFPSKLNTAVQIAFVAFILFRSGLDFETEIAAMAVEIVSYVVGAITLGSWLAYVPVGLSHSAQIEDDAEKGTAENATNTKRKER